MNKFKVKLAVFWAACSVFSILVPNISRAQELPSLGQASNIMTGRLSNGITYYIVTNPAGQGRADVALVQKTGFDDESPRSAGHSIVHSRGALAKLPHFDEHSPYEFFAEKGIWPGRGGWVSVENNATVYKFSNIVLSNGREALDSTLLLAFDIASAGPSLLKPCYSPENQAIVVAGSIDPGAVLGKMNMLSMLVTRKPASPRQDNYKWGGTQYRDMKIEPAVAPGTAELVLSYALARTPRANMGTIQPFVTQKFVYEMGILLRRCILRRCEEAGLPVAGVDCTYRSAAQGPLDEAFEVRVRTSQERLLELAEILASTLAALDHGGVTAKEYAKVQHLLVMQLNRTYADSELTNASYVDKCISSYLYGSTLAGHKDIMNFFASREIDPERGARLFNNYVSAVLDVRKNLTMTLRADGISQPELETTFEMAWNHAANLDGKLFAADSLSIKSISGKTKLKLASSEPMTGGQTWLFQNGITVVWKRVPGLKNFKYGWRIRGGHPMVQGMREGEARHMDRIPELYGVSGMRGSDFRDILHTNGIEMGFDVSVSDFTISGEAPTDRLSLLLKSLLALSRTHSLDNKAAEWYLKCSEIESKFLMDSPVHDAARADSLLYPGYAWTERFCPVPVAEDFLRRADKYFSAAFSRMNDGVFILVGDFDETALKRTLCQYLGAFPTEKVSTFRAASRNVASKSRKVEIRTGSRPRINIALSTELTYSADNYMASIIAARCLRDRVAKAVSSSGWTVAASWDFDMFPQERFNCRLRLEPAAHDGLPSSMLPSDSVDMMVSRALAAIDLGIVEGVSPGRLSAYKTLLSNELNYHYTLPTVLLSTLELRYSYGKDLMTRYQDKISGMGADKVNAVLSALARGSSAVWATRVVRNEVVTEAKMTMPQMEVAPVMSVLDTSSRVYPLYRRSIDRPSADSLQRLLHDYARRYHYPKPDPIKGPSLPQIVDTLAVRDSLVVVDTIASAPVDSLFWSDPIREEEILML